MTIVDHIFGIIAPHECLCCSAEGVLLCDCCAKDLPDPPRRCYRCRAASETGLLCSMCRVPLSGLVAASCYEGISQELVHRFKFARASAASVPIAAAIARNLKVRPHDLVTYIPTATTRIRERGYDHAKLIGEEVARRLDLPCLSLLVRDGQERQVGKSERQRRTQMKGAFRAVHIAALQNREVVLIDDVLTTGSTLEEAASVLLRAGARRVCAAVFAAVP